MDESAFISGMKAGLTGVIGGLVTVTGFLSRFQTKKGCKNAHAQHDIVMNLEKQLLEQKIDTIHDSVLKQEKLIEKIADKLWE